MHMYVLFDIQKQNKFVDIDSCKNVNVVFRLLSISKYTIGAMFICLVRRGTRKNSNLGQQIKSLIKSVTITVTFRVNIKKSE